jgi:catechol 2,3-dioxygenase-like lactoylglutathione lyase family enzyme
MKQSISFVTFAVRDFSRELAFYRDVLGSEPFNVVEDTIAFFNVGSNVGSLVFSLCEYKELSADVGSELATQPPLGVTLALNVPDESAVDDLFAQLRAAGTTIVKQPVRASWGGYSGYFADPEGHLWEIAYNPQVRLEVAYVAVETQKLRRRVHEELTWGSAP